MTVVASPVAASTAATCAGSVGDRRRHDGELGAGERRRERLRRLDRFPPGGGRERLRVGIPADDPGALGLGREAERGADQPGADDGEPGDGH